MGLKRKGVNTILIIILSLCIACDNNEQQDEESPFVSQKGNCSQENDLHIQLDEPDISSLDFSYQTAIKSGYSINGNKNRQVYSVIFSNEPLILSESEMYFASEDQYIFQIDFMGETVSKEEDEIPLLEEGTFKAGDMLSDRSLVRAFGWTQGETKYGNKTILHPNSMTGEGTITHLTRDHICGQVKMTVDGHAFTASFNIDVKVDRWDKFKEDLQIPH